MAAKLDGGAVAAGSGVEPASGPRIPAPPPDLCPSQWDIYRFEFAFFDLHAQRWQLFQEGLGVGGGVGHRAQIELLLRSLREAFEAIPRGTLFNSVARSATAPDSGTTKPPLRLDKTAWKSFGNGARDHWKSFVDELEKNADHGGLLDLRVEGESSRDEKNAAGSF